MCFLTLKLPRIVKVNDYHEFKWLENHLRQIGLKNIKVKEVGFFDHTYVGITYIKKDKEYYKLIRKYKELI